MRYCSWRYHVCTPPPKLSSVKKKFGSGLIFCVFASVACILIGKDEEYEKMEKRMRKFRTPCAMTFSLFLIRWFVVFSITCPFVCLQSWCTNCYGYSTHSVCLSHTHTHTHTLTHSHTHTHTHTHTHHTHTNTHSVVSLCHVWSLPEDIRKQCAADRTNWVTVMASWSCFLCLSVCSLDSVCCFPIRQTHRRPFSCCYHLFLINSSSASSQEV